jgi:hypothetical protein
MDKINVTTKLTFEDFRKVNFYFLYRKTGTKVALAIGTILLLIIGFSYATGTTLFTQFPIIPFALALVMTVFPPYSVFRTARKNYDSNKMINERIEYEFDKEQISISGESFHSKLSWDKIYELSTTKSWFLVWQNRQIANVIPRRDISDKQIESIKALVKDIGQLRKSFK